MANLGLNTVILLTVVLFLFAKYFSRNFNYWKKKKVFYVKPLIFFGNFLDIVLFRISIGEYLAKLYNLTDEPFFGIFVFNTPHMVIKSPELIKMVLVRDFQNFDDRTVITGSHDVMTANMLFINKNPTWKVMRKQMTPVFTSGKLKAMVPLINEVGENLKMYLEKNNKEHSSMEVKEICSKYSTDVIAKCAFGIEAHCFDLENADFRNIGRLMFDFRWPTAIQQISGFFLPSLVNLFRMRFLDKRITDFMRIAFWQTIEERRKNPDTKYNDVIDTLMEMIKNEEFKKLMNFEGDVAVAQAGMFFAAGFETTSSVMAFTLYELCLHQEIQTRVRNEILSAIKDHGGLTYDSINSMKYLNMCICETLRKYPVLPFLDRRCKSDYEIPGTNVVIEKGTPLYIPMFGLHYDEKFFPNPKSYDPERFSDSNSHNIVPFSYIPFGVGPRNCIGERFGLIGTKIGLAHILTEYEVQKTSKTPVPLILEPKSFVVVSKVGLPMRFKKVISSVA